MFRRRLEMASCLIGAALYSAACGENPGSETPSEEPLGDSPMGVVQLAIKDASCKELEKWKYTNINVIVSEYKLDGADAGVNPTLPDTISFTPRMIQDHCALSESTRPALATLNLRPWVYQVRIEVIAKVDGTEFQLNVPNGTKVVVSSSAVAPVSLSITRAAARSVPVDATVGPWNL